MYICGTYLPHCQLIFIFHERQLILLPAIKSSLYFCCCWHRWYWAKGIDTDEAYVLSCYDSRTDGRARFTPHTAFKNPGSSPGAPPRKSIEIRALVFWENGSADENSLDPY